jgi:hypothetical protein
MGNQINCQCEPTIGRWRVNDPHCPHLHFDGQAVALLLLWGRPPRRLITGPDPAPLPAHPTQAIPLTDETKDVRLAPIGCVIGVQHLERQPN